MQWGLTIGSVYFNSIDIIVFVLAIIGGIADTLTGFADAFSHRSGYIVGFFPPHFTCIIARCIWRSFSRLDSLQPDCFCAPVPDRVWLMRISAILELRSIATGLRAVNGLLGSLGRDRGGHSRQRIIYVLDCKSLRPLPIFDASQIRIILSGPWFPTRSTGSHPRYR